VSEDGDCEQLSDIAMSHLGQTRKSLTELSESASRLRADIKRTCRIGRLGPTGDMIDLVEIVEDRP